MGPVTKQLVFGIIVPVQIDGESRYALVRSPGQPALSRLVATNELPPGWHTVVCDAAAGVRFAGARRGCRPRVGGHDGRGAGCSGRGVSRRWPGRFSAENSSSGGPPMSDRSMAPGSANVVKRVWRHADILAVTGNRFRGKQAHADLMQGHRRSRGHGSKSRRWAARRSRPARCPSYIRSQ
jgi:hypothetical protein